MSIRYDVHDTMAVITVDNPPVNSLGHDVRAGIAACVDHAQADEAVKAIIIIGTEKAFSAGADIRELNTPRANAEPTLNTLIRIVEASGKRVRIDPGEPLGTEEARRQALRSLCLAVLNLNEFVYVD